MEWIVIIGIGIVTLVNTWMSYNNDVRLNNDYKEHKEKINKITERVEKDVGYVENRLLSCRVDVEFLVKEWKEFKYLYPIVNYLKCKEQHNTTQKLFKDEVESSKKTLEASQANLASFKKEVKDLFK